MPFEHGAAFDRLLADVSVGFINLLPEQVDAAITDALRRIARLLDVDRTQLIRFVGSGGGARVTHSGAVEGFAEGAPDIALAKAFPWALARVRRGEVTVYARLADLPAEAAVDVAVWRRYGVKSEIIVPLRIDGSVDGAIVLDSDRAEREWPPELIARVEVLTSIFGSALAHQRARAALDAAMRFERAASEIMARLLGAPASARDRAIEEGLGAIARALGADRAKLWRRARADKGFVLTHRGPVVEPAEVPASAGAQLPWIEGELEQGRVVRFSRRAELPAEAAADVQALQAMQIGAAMVVPLRLDGRLAGALSLSTRREGIDWPQELLGRARLLGEALAGCVAVQDAERRELEAQAQATHAARVGSMGVFTASLVHELTQPVAASLANAETAADLFASQSPDRDALQATIADMVCDSRRAADMIQKLRRFLRHGESERGEFDLIALLAEVQALVRPEASAKGVVLVSAHEGAAALPLHGDRVQVQQVLINLMVNALDAVAANAPGARCVEVGAGGGAEGSWVTITDNGPGMDEATVTRIFQPFFTTKPGGMGLGLSISRSIVASHGGVLTAQSAPGRGATFRIELPHWCELAAPGSAQQAEAAVDARDRVFVVDDDPALRRALERQLESAGYAVEGYADGHAFLDRARIDGPACIVSDLRMPGMSGLELQAALARAGQDCPVVFVSAHADVATSVQAMRAGAVALLTKPVARAELLATVADALERSRRQWRDRNELVALRARRAALTLREGEVFAEVVAGRLNKTIADRLGIAETTVKIHRGRVMEKMQAASVAELVRMAQRLGEAAAPAAPAAPARAAA